MLLVGIEKVASHSAAYNIGSKTSNMEACAVEEDPIKRLWLLMYIKELTVEKIYRTRTQKKEKDAHPSFKPVPICFHMLVCSSSQCPLGLECR